MSHIKQINSNLYKPESTHEKIDPQLMFITNMEQHETNYTAFVDHANNKSNPHGVTASQLGAVTTSTYNGHTGTSATSSVLGHVKVDTALSTSSTNPVQNKVIKSAIDTANTNIDTLTTDVSGLKTTIGTHTTDISTLTSGLSTANNNISTANTNLTNHSAVTASSSALGHVKVDTALSTTSTSPVQNKVIKSAIDTLTTNLGTTNTNLGTTNTNLSNHSSTSATDSVLGHVKVDTGLSTTSTNPVQNKAIKSAIDTLTTNLGTANTNLTNHANTTATDSVLGHVKVDSSLSTTSANPVQNKVVKGAIDTLTSSVNTANTNIGTLTTDVSGLKTTVGGHTTSISTANTNLTNHAGTSATDSALGHVKVDTALSTSSTNPVQNKAIKSAIDTLTTNLGTANTNISTTTTNLTNHTSATASSSTLGHVKVDTVLSTTSTNPVQNKVVKSAIDTLTTDLGTINDNATLLSASVEIAHSNISTANTNLTNHSETSASDSALGHVRVDTALSATSTNPVQNKAVKSAVDTLTTNLGTTNSTVSTINTTVSSHTTSINSLNTTVSGHTTSINNNASTISAINTSVSNHYSATASTSALGHVKVDSAMSSTSTNPVQNKIVLSAINAKITYGTADLTAGTSTLATGAIYVMYE